MVSEKIANIERSLKLIDAGPIYSALRKMKDFQAEIEEQIGVLRTVITKLIEEVKYQHPKDNELEDLEIKDEPPEDLLEEWRKGDQEKLLKGQTLRNGTIFCSETEYLLMQNKNATCLICNHPHRFHVFRGHTTWCHICNKNPFAIEIYEIEFCRSSSDELPETEAMRTTESTIDKNEV